MSRTKMGLIAGLVAVWIALVYPASAYQAAPPCPGDSGCVAPRYSPDPDLPPPPHPYTSLLNPALYQMITGTD